MTRYFKLICDEIPQDLLLLDAGPRPLDAARVLQGLTGVGLWRAKEKVTEGPPIRLLEGVSVEQARDWAERLIAVGASVEVRTWWRYRPGKTPLPLE
ncbi:ribosomal protein L7/L12 [Streptacidiphilus rugosus]|uniref:ribosomal protein L7/L12 n=1 Tax=Streptacidiphilus rugosus TaxID=405783 RepID=UPI0018DCDF88|nr:ribosomal protein L7/L12 [Streptacidiphilus rugosus]